jgi:photosystem II stability/assembly factor-like uncharacterized protein
MRAFRAGWAGLLSLCLFLSACGGGGSDGETPITPLPTSVSINSVTTADTDAPVQFSSDVANPTGGLTFLWDFGDGTNSAEPSPTHPFATPGDYQISLTVSNEDGDVRSANFTVTVRRLGVVKDLACSAADAKGWCWQRPRPIGNRIHDITFADASNGWVVGEAGQILKTADGGTTWVPQTSQVTADLRHVRFANSTTGWVIGDDGVALRTTDGGASWTRQASDARSSGQPMGLGLVVLDQAKALAIFNYNAPRSTVDGGETWITAKVVPEEVTEDGTLWAADHYSGVRKSTRMGVDEPTVSFSLNDGYLRHFTMGNARTGLLMTYDWSTPLKSMFRTRDGGTTWDAVAPVGLPEYVEYLKLFGNSVAWAAGNGGLFRSVDAGSSWTSVRLPHDASDPSYGLHAQDERTLWFRQGGGYYITTDAGSHWTRLEVTQELYTASSLHVGAAGLWLTYDSRVYRSLDGGASWTQVFGNAADEQWTGLSSVWFFDQHKGLAVGNGGWLLETSNGGRDWVRKGLTGQSGGYAKLQFASPTHGWLSGDWGVSKTTDGGASWWTPTVNAGLINVSDFHFADARHGWAISGSVLHRSTDGGDTWERLADLPFWGKSIRFLDTNVGVATGHDGAIYRTEDGGATWTSRPRDGFEEMNRIVFVGASTAWAVGEYGSVMTSIDAGLTWTRVLVPPRVSLRDVWFTDPSHGWIVGDRGTVLATVDGGKTWGMQATHVASDLRGVFFLDAYTAWIVGNDGLVLATATGGQ